MAGKLNGERADTARSGMDQHLLATLHLRAIDQNLPCREADEGTDAASSIVILAGFRATSA